MGMGLGIHTRWRDALGRLDIYRPQKEGRIYGLHIFLFDLAVYNAWRTRASSFNIWLGLEKDGM
jgi:hypothetical protein